MSKYDTRRFLDFPITSVWRKTNKYKTPDEPIRLFFRSRPIISSQNFEIDNKRFSLGNTFLYIANQTPRFDYTFNVTPIPVIILLCFDIILYHNDVTLRNHCNTIFNKRPIFPGIPELAVRHYGF